MSKESFKAYLRSYFQAPPMHMRLDGSVGNEPREDPYHQATSSSAEKPEDDGDGNLEPMHDKGVAVVPDAGTESEGSGDATTIDDVKSPEVLELPQDGDYHLKAIIKRTILELLEELEVALVGPYLVDDSSLLPVEPYELSGHTGLRFHGRPLFSYR